MKYNRGLFVFRQDLRTIDNTGLYHAVNNCKNLMLIFVFDEMILSKSPANDKRLGFLLDAIKNIEAQIEKLGGRLYVFHGKPETILTELIKKHKIDGYFCNKSYGPRSKTRDTEIKKFCYDNGVGYEESTDFLIFDPDEIEQRKVFTPFYKLWQKKISSEYSELMEGNYKLLKIGNINNINIEHNNEIVYKRIDTGENLYRPIDFVHKRIGEFDLGRYEATRNSLDTDGTTRLSPYLRFGIISVRELFARGVEIHQIKHGNKSNEVKNHYVSELAWREFWYHIMYYFPETENIEFQEKRRQIKRSRNDELFDAWANGKTGYPIVDAAMKQLKEENRMHGRARMIVASFLTKDMLIDWRWGELEFSKYLLDYDFAVNIGNRQWSASVGADPKPLRIFNPILQSQKFDPMAKYIIKYLPELENQPIKAIHDPLKYKLNYITPIVDHYQMSKKAKDEYLGR